MEYEEDEEYTKLYPGLVKLPKTEDDSTQATDLNEKAGEEYVINHRSSPRTHSPIQSPSSRSPSTHSTNRKTNFKDTQQKSTTFAWLSLVAVLLIVVLSCIYYNYSGKNVYIRPKREWKTIVTKLQPHLMEKSYKFPSQKESIWFQISSGLQGLSNDPKKPAVYLLTYDENSMHPSSCIVEVITTAANNFLLGKNGWSFLNGSLLIESQINDPGELIEKIANTVETHKIIVITDLQHIPAKLAQGFHFLVDEYNPKIREAVYVLTLKIPSHLKSSRPVEAAENTLKESWKDLKFDLLLPLIARVTNQVLPVMAENSEISCPLITSVTTEIHI